LERYQSLSEDEKLQFFIDVLNEFGTDKEALDIAVKLWVEDQSEAAARNLHFIAEPRSQNLIRRLNQAPNATLSLVNIRTDLLNTFACCCSR